MNGLFIFEFFLLLKNIYNVDVYIYNKYSYDRVVFINFRDNFELILYIDCIWNEDKNSFFFIVLE